MSVHSTQAQCVVPFSLTATPNPICAGAQVTLNATAPTNSIGWYTSPTGGVSTGTSASGANFNTTAVATTTYYAESFIPANVGGTTTLVFTGSVQTIIVPPGVTQLTVAAAGAQGGTNGQGALGGLGGSAAGILTVTPGDVLSIYVGGSNGFNGGGISTNTACPTAIGGNGGGASDIRLNGVALTNRVLVAGGGGGAAGNRVNTCGRGSGGGGGGGYYGGGGGASWPQASIIVPTGGDQVSGGIGGTSSFSVTVGSANGFPGSLGLGGNGGIEVGSNQAGNQIGATGGVGGGTVGSIGIYAGNFSGQSGAGGSSYIGGVLAGTTTAGVRSGDGQVVIIGLSGGCVSASRTPIIVTVNPSPTVSIVGSNSVCAGSSATLTASGATTYSWSTGATSASISVTPSVNTIYSVNGTNVGCSANASQTINVSTPTVAIAGASVVCSGNSLTLTASGANSYSWSNGPNTAVNVVSPTTNTIYNVSGTNANGCVGIASRSVNVVAVSVSIAGPSTVCAGSSVILTASGASSYSWSNGATTASISVTPSVTSIFTATGTTAGCVGSNIQTVSVTTVSVSITGPSTVCAGSSLTLTASGLTTYTWNTGSNVATTIVSPTANITYTTMGTGVGSCTAMATKAVTVVALPVVNLIATPTIVCVNGNTSTLATTPPGGVITGSNVSGSVFTPGANAGTFTPIYTFVSPISGCTGTTSTNIVVSLCTGLSSQSIGGTLQVYPNPAHNSVTIELDNGAEKTIEIMDLTGRVVSTQHFTSSSLLVNISQLANGIYHVKLSSNGATEMMKLVKE